MCPHEHTNPLVSPSPAWVLDFDVVIHTCLETWIFVQSPHTFPSEQNMLAPSPAHCAAPLPLPRASQAFSSSPLHSCVLIPKTIAALFTCLQDLVSSFVSFYPINLLFSSPPHLLIHCFPLSLDASSSTLSQVSFLCSVFLTISSGSFWCLLSITCRIQNCYWN